MSYTDSSNAERSDCAEALFMVFNTDQGNVKVILTSSESACRSRLRLKRTVVNEICCLE